MEENTRIYIVCPQVPQGHMVLTLYIIKGYMFKHDDAIQVKCVLCQLPGLPCVQELLHGKFVRLLVLYDMKSFLVQAPFLIVRE